MGAITFRTMMGKDQLIRLPEGSNIPEGPLEVTVKQIAQAAPGELATTRNWLLTLAHDVEKLAPRLPTDLAENHDHYAHGKPRS